MKISDLPEKKKIYLLILSNKSDYVVNGKQKENIINSPQSFVILPNGSTINKNFIIEFRLDTERTRELYFGSNQEKKILLSDEIKKSEDYTKLINKTDMNKREIPKVSKEAYLIEERINKGYKDTASDVLDSL